MTDLRRRVTQDLPEPDAGAGLSVKEGEHPAGEAKHGGPKQLLLAMAFTLFMCASCCSCHMIQILGSPMYFFNRDYYYAFMAFTKQQFGLITNCITAWFAPTKVRISGDSSVKGQLSLDKQGYLVTSFPARLVLIANHQIYTDWLYLWWISYTARMHGHIFIILKESLKYIPVIGPGMMFYDFIFLARNWAKDKPRFEHSIKKLDSRHGGRMAGARDADGSKGLDPAWLLIFPEGTNLCPNGRKASQKWAEKQGIPDMQHQLLPRTTGLQFCLQGLRETMPWVYDCTITYEGIPRGSYGQDVFTLRSMYFAGRAPKSVNMYWRRFATKDIPIDDTKAFDLWLRERWLEKDRLIENYIRSGRFPEDESGGAGPSGYIETAVGSRSFEWVLIFAPSVLFVMCLYGFCGLKNGFT